MTRHKSNQEILPTFSVEAKDNVIFLTYLKNKPEIEDDVRQAGLVEKAFTEICARNPHTTYGLLVDLFATPGWRLVPSGSRAIYAKMVGQAQVKKVAVAGTSGLLSIAAKIILEASGKKGTLRWFTNKEEALKRLLKD